MAAEAAGRVARGTVVAACGLVLAWPAAATLGALVFALRDAAAGWAGPPIVAPQRWLLLLRNTVEMAAVAVLVSILAGGLLGLAVGRCDAPGRRWLAAVLVLAASLPLPVVTVFVFVLWPASELSGSAALAGVIYGIYYTPLVALAALVAWRAVPTELEDLTRLDCGWLRTLAVVGLPWAAPLLAGAALLTTWLTVTDFAISDLLGVRTFAEETLTQYVLHRRAGGPLMTGVPLLMGFAGLAAVGLQRWKPARTIEAAWRGAGRLIPLGRGRWWLAATLWSVLAATWGVPAWFLAQRVGSLYRLVERAAGFAPTLADTACWSAAAASATVGCGLVLTASVRGRWWTAVAVGALLCLAVPGPVVGVTLCELANRTEWLSPLLDGPVVLVGAYVARFSAPAILVMAAAGRRVPLEVEDQARIDGADWLRRLWVVYWPWMRPVAAVTWLVVVILCFGETAATKFVVPPGRDTVSSLMLSFLHARVESNLATLAAVSALGVAVLWAVLLMVLGLGRRPSQPEGLGSR